MALFQVFPGLQALNYQRHSLHTEAYSWVEKNCYIDLIIEIIHAQGLDPLAMLPFTLAVDFEGDQWTFFKPQFCEIRELYGIDIQEMSVWRPLIEHAQEHLNSGRLISVEVDSFWLPDTVATDYRRNHVKTTIALANLDISRQTLGYFHNTAYFELSGQDFREIFRLDYPEDPTYLPLFAELIHFKRLLHRPKEELVGLSLQLLRRYLNLKPLKNPMLLYEDRFKSELLNMQTRGMPYYHAWAFNNARQVGAAFELAAAYLHWLEQSGISGLTSAIEQFTAISDLNKSLILKIARSVATGRTFNQEETFTPMAKAWENGMMSLEQNSQI